MVGWSEGNKKGWKCKECHKIPRLVDYRMFKDGDNYYCGDCGGLVYENWLEKTKKRHEKN